MGSFGSWCRRDWTKCTPYHNHIAINTLISYSDTNCCCGCDGISVTSCNMSATLLVVCIGSCCTYDVPHHCAYNWTPVASEPFTRTHCSSTFPDREQNNGSDHACPLQHNRYEVCCCPCTSEARSGCTQRTREPSAEQADADECHQQLHLRAEASADPAQQPNCVSCCSGSTRSTGHKHKGAITKVRITQQQ